MEDLNMGNIDRNKILLKDFDSLDLQRVQKIIVDLTSTRTDELLEEYNRLKEENPDYNFMPYSYNGTIYFMIRPKGVSKSRRLSRCCFVCG